MIEFKEFPKIARLSRTCTITEKLDGTNAAVQVVKLPEGVNNSKMLWDQGKVIWSDGVLALFAQSRTRFITPADDNYGFAAWVEKNAEELAALGEGAHFGEWWGQGIQRKYGIAEKRFSLFNTHRWNEDNKPACCHVVPVLYRGMFDTNEIGMCLTSLANLGSRAAPGFMNPEGIMVYHEAAGIYFKKTIRKDEEPKGKQR